MYEFIRLCILEGKIKPENKEAYLTHALSKGWITEEEKQILMAI